MALSALFSLFLVAPVAAAEVNAGWRGWWLPPDHSTHGGSIDLLFGWIFWIAMLVTIGVEVALVVFAIRFRRRRNDTRRATFIHGHLGLEALWTAIPLAIFAGIAVASERIWDDYRSPAKSTSTLPPATVLVIGQQFQWNYIYPGADGKLGRYLIYPKPTDLAWPDGKVFHRVHGPAELPADAARAAIDDYITTNPLGKDPNDPDGRDDNWTKFPGRALILPRGRPIIVRLTSRDVIHDFFLPNFRVKLDAVPGLLGRIDFEAIDSMPTSSERESASKQGYSLSDFKSDALEGELRRLTISIGAADAARGAMHDPVARQWLFKDAAGTIIRDGQPLRDPGDVLRKIHRLQSIGVKSVTAFQPGDWDLVCEQLCGAGHTTMQGSVRFVTNEEYDAMKFDLPSNAHDHSGTAP